MTQTTEREELDTQIAALKQVTTKVYLPMLLAGVLKVGVVHLVGRKLFPNTFTSVGRTCGVMYLAARLTRPLKPTKEMKDALTEYKEIAQIAR